MNAALAVSAQADPIITPDGLSIRLDWLDRGLAKLNGAGEQLPADAADHVIVYDVASGLMEAVNAPGFAERMDHDEATAKAASLVHGGFSDWQLPDVSEALHAVDYGRFDPAADVSVYPDIVGSYYWTRQQTAWSLEEAGSSRSFFCVGMHHGNVDYFFAGGRLRARPVRRAAPASQCLVIGQ